MLLDVARCTFIDDCSIPFCTVYAIPCIVHCTTCTLTTKVSDIRQYVYIRTLVNSHASYTKRIATMERERTWWREEASAREREKCREGERETWMDIRWKSSQSFLCHYAYMNSSLGCE